MTGRPPTKFRTTTTTAGLSPVKEGPFTGRRELDRYLSNWKPTVAAMVAKGQAIEILVEWFDPRELKWYEFDTHKVRGTLK